MSAASQLDDFFYNTRRFQAICLFAFFTFSRVGEITSSVPGNTIHLNQVLKLLNDRHKVQAIKVAFLRRKHNHNQALFSLVVPVKFLAALSSTYWLTYKLVVIILTPFFRCAMVLPFPDQCCVKNFQLLSNLLDSIHRGTRATASVSGLHLMRLIRVCLTLTFEPWGSGNLMPF